MASPNNPNNAKSYTTNANVKADGVEEQWTQETLQEYAKCMKDPVYFATNYCKIIHPDRGLVPFDMYPYQEKMYKNFNENRFNIVLACRQSGKSISSVIWLLWSAIFSPECTIGILANKGKTAQEVLGRLTLALENLPFFLQPGCKALNKTSIEFSNNSRILSASTSSSSIRGYTLNILFLDEFAFVQNATEFYTSTYPVVTAGKTTKVIVTSTANGIGNAYHRLWQGANENRNMYVPFRVDWWDVPGRDEKWKEETIANTSELQFEQEYGNNFLGTSDTLISGSTLLDMRACEPLEIREEQSFFLYERPKKDSTYMMTVDVAKGRGQDYSTFTIIDISDRPFRQVAVYRNNTISPLLFPDIIYKYANLYNKAYVVVESNDQGSIVCNTLCHDLEYENMHFTSVVKANGIGIEMNRKTKRIGCSGIKDLLETNKLELRDETTILELSTFVAHKQSYRASEGNHDDLVMNLVLFGFYATSYNFQQLTDIDVRKMMYEKKAAEIQADVPFFGVVSNPVAEEVEEIKDPWNVLDFKEADGNYSLVVEDW